MHLRRSSDSRCAVLRRLAVDVAWVLVLGVVIAVVIVNILRLAPLGDAARRFAEIGLIAVIDALLWRHYGPRLMMDLALLATPPTDRDLATSGAYGLV